MFRHDPRRLLLLIPLVCATCLAPKEELPELPGTDGGTTTRLDAPPPADEGADRFGPDGGPDGGAPGDTTGAGDGAWSLDAAAYPGVAPLAQEVFVGAREVAPVVDREVRAVLRAMIDHAGASICVLAFEFVDSHTTKEVEDALKRAAGRGVKVRLLIDEVVSDSAGFVARLKAAGVDARLDGTKTTAHTKMLVVDGRYALVGSTNLSRSSIDFNAEVNLIFSGTGSVQTAEGYCRDRHADPLPMRLVLGPSQGAVKVYGDRKISEALTEAVANAKERIDAVVYTVSANPDFPDGEVMRFLDALGAAAKRGVTVRVLLEQSSFDPGINAVNDQARGILLAKGIQVRFDSPEVQTHAKLLVADGVAVVATANWSYSGFRLNHELAVRTAEPRTVELLRSYAEQRFNSGSDTLGSAGKP